MRGVQRRRADLRRHRLVAIRRAGTAERADRVDAVDQRVMGRQVDGANRFAGIRTGSATRSRNGPIVALRGTAATSAPAATGNTVTAVSFTMEFPTTPMAGAALAIVRRSEAEAIVNHSARSFFFAELLAIHEGLHHDSGYDRELLFAATVMHDLGTGALAPGRARFEVEGADLAAEVLAEHRVPQADIDRVWEAIALHTSPGIAERRGLLAYLTAEGSKMDIGFNAPVTASYQAAIHAAYPRLRMVRTLTDAIVDHAARSETAAPIYSMGQQFALERRESGATQLERLAAGLIPWGE
ncbi:HD domain-containing protein [Nocardia xishanensis]|uniref:HD domain-containing protein n=1 Tax=Nocardia xishanensis TaxID=238964 RepID=UPI00343A70A8